jgi:integrase
MRQSDTDDEKPKRILSPDELARLLQSVDPAYRLIFELEAETGARLGEVLGLTWQDIDLEDETITFAAQLDRNGQRQQLKTKRSRCVLEVTPSLVAKLREHKLAQALSGPHDLVFVGRTGRGHDHRNIGGRVLARAVKREG